MFETLIAAASASILGSSTTPGILQRLRDRMQSRPASVKERVYTSKDIACVAAAIAAREAALSAGAQTHGNAVTSAYTTRAGALANAYTQTGGNSVIRDAVKKAWGSFRSSIQTARKNWQSARDAAWAQFRSVIKNCKAPTEVLDTANTTSEAKGE